MDIFETLAEITRPEPQETVKIEIYHDGELKQTYENQLSDTAALGYLHRHQSNSSEWAIKYEGWRVKVTSEQNPNDFYFWLDRSI